MDKATKVAVEKYPHGTFDGEIGDSLRAACAVGYMQAQKDTIERAMNVLNKQIDDLFYSRLTIGDFLKQFRKAMEV